MKEKSKKKQDIKPTNGKTFGKFPLAPGYSDEYIYAFLAQNLEQLPHPPNQDEDEDIEVVLMSPEELEEIIYRGSEVDAKSVTAYFFSPVVFLEQN